MSTWIYIIIGIAVLIILFIYFKNKAKGIPVLKSKISSTNGIDYKVQFEKLHPEFKNVEYVRNVLNFTAKILFVVEKKHNYVCLEILDFIKNISNTKMTSEDIEQFLPYEISVDEGFPEGKLVEGVLYFKNVNTRNIDTKIPISFFEYQLAHSVIALIKVTIDKLDDFQREDLKNSLKYMSNMYENGTNYRDLKVMANLPNQAFVSQMF